MSGNTSNTPAHGPCLHETSCICMTCTKLSLSNSLQQLQLHLQLQLQEQTHKFAALQWVHAQI